MTNTENSMAHDLPWLREKIGLLSGFMLPERVEGFHRVLDRRTRYMTVCMENTYHPQNASALIRHCDAFGLQDLYAIEGLCKFRPNVNVVKGTDKWVTLRRYKTTHDALQAMKTAGYRIIATTPHSGDDTPESFDVTAGPFALVFGTEHEGISNEVMEQADGFLRIPMQGFVESLNVSASAAILIYMLSERVRAAVGNWRLTEEEKIPILFEWMKKSVRESGKILARYEEQKSGVTYT